MATTVQLPYDHGHDSPTYHTIMATTVQLPCDHGHDSLNYHTIMATTVQLPYDHGHDSPTTIRSWPRQSNYHTINATTVPLRNHMGLVFMVFNVTFNNISVLLVEETR
jgi:hypothetical protein